MGKVVICQNCHGHGTVTVEVKAGVLYWHCGTELPVYDSTESPWQSCWHDWESGNGWYTQKWDTGV